MGLAINYGRLDDVLLQLYMDEDHIAERAARAKSTLLQAIEKQTGAVATYPLEPAPPAHLTGTHFGSYATIHLLRMFAARSVGYTLDEAYELEVDSVTPNAAEAITEHASEPEGAPEEDEGSADASAESDFEEFYGVPIDTVWPAAPNRVSPFPYYNLVCFSDAEGIYVPMRFSRPIELEGYFYVGSALRLNEELDELRDDIYRMHDIGGSGDSAVAQYFQLVASLWETLNEACSYAVENSVSMVFE